MGVARTIGRVILLSAGLALASGARGEVEKIPFATDPAWATGLEEARLCQLAEGRILLVLVWADYDTDTRRIEKNFLNWKEVTRTLPSFCRLHLRASENREVLGSWGVTLAPCLVMVGGNPLDPFNPVEEKVLGLLEDLNESEPVVAFLKKTLEGEIRGLFGGLEEEEAAPARVLSATELVEKAKSQDGGDDPLGAMESYDRALEKIPSASTELRRTTLLEAANLAYSIGNLEKAREYYEEAGKLFEGIELGPEILELLYRLALLLNDAGDHEKAREVMTRRIELESDPAEKKRLEDQRAAIEEGFYVLAQLGYPGVGDRLRKGGGAEPPSEDRGVQSLSFEERLAKVEADLARIQGELEQQLRETKAYPDYLEDLPGYRDAPDDALRDPFFKDSDYQYLHFEDPEEYLLYSVGPDGEDQFGETAYDPAQGGEGKGDIAIRSAPGQLKPRE